MAGARSGFPEQSGPYGLAVPIVAAESPSQSNPSPPDSETSSSGNWTIGKSFHAARRRAQLRISDPELPTMPLEIPQIPQGKTPTRITPPLAEEAASPPNHLEEQIAVQHRLPTDFSLSQTPPLPLPQHGTSLSSRHVGAAELLLDPKALTHLHLEKITRKLEAVAIETPSIINNPQTDTTEPISAASLIDPGMLSSEMQTNEKQIPPDVSDAHTIPMDSLPAQPRNPLQTTHPPFLPYPIPRPISYAARQAENSASTSYPPKKERKNPLETPFITGLARVLGPVIQPLEKWKTRRAIARLNPEDRAIVDAFLYPQLPETPEEQPLTLPDLEQQNLPTQENSANSHPVQIPAEIHPPYALPGEYHITEKGQKLEIIEYALADTDALRRHRNHHNEFVGFTRTGERTTFSLHVNKNDDIICSAFSEDGQQIQVFLANPLDNTYPHATRMAFGLRSVNEKDTFYSLNPTEGEIKRMQQIARQIAQLTADSLQTIQHSPKTKQQLQHVFLVALSHIWNEPIPLSEPAPVLLRDSTWPAIETMQYDRSLTSSQHFQAHFHFVTPQDREGLQLPAVNQQPYAINDLCIDGFARDSQAASQERNLFFVLSREGIPRVLNANFAQIEKITGLTVLRGWAVSFLSALTYRDVSQPVGNDEKTITTKRIQDVIVRLQRFLLEYPPGSDMTLRQAQ